LKRFLSYLKIAALFVTVLCLAGMMAASAAQYFDPLQHWVFALLGLCFLPMLALTVFFLIFWIIVRIRLAWIPFIGLLVALPGLLHIVSFNVFKAKSHSAQHDLKLMTYNVRNFDLYNWSDESATRRKMMSMIGDERPDVACFQEFFTSDDKAFDNASILTKTIGFNYNHTEITTTVGGNQHWGIATFSNFPIVGKGRVDFPMKTNNACIYTDLNVKGTTVRLYNVHLQSIYLTRKDYAYIEDFQSDRNKMSPIANERILTKLRNAYRLRGEQVNLIEQSVEASPYPVLLCGDFNDTPVSYAYRVFNKTLNDCFLDKGWGISPTYNGMIPLLRIDYVLHDTSFQTLAYRRLTQAYSDHYPVITELNLAKQPSTVR